jgi:hypothetical protein
MRLFKMVDFGDELRQVNEVKPDGLAKPTRPEARPLLLTPERR